MHTDVALLRGILAKVGAAYPRGLDRPVPARPCNHPVIVPDGRMQPRPPCGRSRAERAYAVADFAGAETFATVPPGKA